MNRMIDSVFVCVLIGWFVVLIGGCEHKVSEPKSAPIIKVSDIDSNYNSITIHYLNHDSPHFRDDIYKQHDVYVELKNLEEIRNYKKEVEFLLSRLEDIENKMKVEKEIP